MDNSFLLVFVTFYYFVILESSYQTLLKIATKKSNYQKREDYTFEGMLNRARDECAFMQNVNNTVNRNKTIQMIKEKIINKRLKEFYEKQEKERQLAKEYYESVKFQMKRRLLQGESPEWGPKFGPPGPVPTLPHHPLHKRSTDSKGRRRKSSNPFSGISFTDHNNCSGRCVFSMMDMVNPQGFPDESLIIKLIDDKIPNRKLRLGKMKKVINCFKNIEKATKSLPNRVGGNHVPLDVPGAFVCE